MFLENKYTLYYNRIIDNALLRGAKPSGYTEKHHRVPKSCGGTSQDLVILTAREHFICHLLLTKMMVSTEHRKKMVYAFHAMRYLKSNKHEKRYVTSHTFQRLRAEHVECVRARQTGVRHTNESKNKISENKRGKKWSDSMREKRELYHRNSKNHFKGKKHTDEVKRILSEKRIKNSHIYTSSEFREKRRVYGTLHNTAAAMHNTESWKKISSVKRSHSKWCGGLFHINTTEYTIVVTDLLQFADENGFARNTIRLLFDSGKTAAQGRCKGMSIKRFHFID